MFYTVYVQYTIYHHGDDKKLCSIYISMCDVLSIGNCYVAGNLKTGSKGSNTLVKHKTLLDATCLTRLSSTIKHVGWCCTV